MRYLCLIPLLFPITPSGGNLNYCPIIWPQKTEINQHDQKCLAVTIYGEARGESEQGMQAVAYTVLNRAVKKALCSVVLAPKQYSVYNGNALMRAIAIDPILVPKQKNIIDTNNWNLSIKVAQDVLRRDIPDITHGATHYLNDHLMHLKHYHYPKWSKEYTITVIIDNHKFFKKEKV